MKLDVLTLQALQKYSKEVGEVLDISKRDFSNLITFEKFTRLSENEYNKIYGATFINVYFEDGIIFRINRHEFDWIPHACTGE